MCVFVRAAFVLVCLFSCVRLRFPRRLKNTGMGVGGEGAAFKLWSGKKKRRRKKGPALPSKEGAGLSANGGKHVTEFIGENDLLVTEG